MIPLRSPDADHWPDTAESEPIALKAHGLRLVARREEKTSVENRVEPLHAEALTTDSRRIEALSTRSLPESSQPNLQARPALATAQVRTGPVQELHQYWECVVEEIGPTKFLAVLRSLKNPNDSEKEAEIPIALVEEDDRELLLPGAVFYWSLGYQTVSGTSKRFSAIKFRRLPAWTKRDLARIESGAAKLKALFALNGSFVPSN
jgi:hypothetical protein